MNKREQYKRLVKFGSAAVILLFEIGLYWLVWTYYFNTIIEYPFFRRGNWLIVALYALLLIFFLQTYGGLKIGFLKRWNIIYSQILSLLIVNTIAYLMLALIDKKFYNPMSFVILTLIDIIAVVIWAFVFQWVYVKIFPPRRLVIVYGERPVFRIMEKLDSREDKYVITGAIHIRRGVDYVMDNVGKFEGVILGDIASHERNLILKKCYECSIRTYMIPKISDILTRSSAELNLFDTPILLSRNEGPQIDQLFVKRVMDIVFSTAGLIVSLPLFLIFATAIKLTDAGPVFYRQKRLTKNGRVFDIIKFRTMRVDAEKDGVARLAGQSDLRITKIGKILRATRLDELPQLINIIFGEMSLVGPRPERPEIASDYEKEFPEFKMRLKVKAGLTGYAQVHGKYNTTAYDKLKLDLTYIRNYSIWLDLKLILMTPKVLFIKESTEGVDDGAIDVAETKRNLREEIYGSSEDLDKRYHSPQ